MPDKMHAALIERSLGGRIIGVIARDATEIEAREKPAANEANDKKDDPPSDGAQPPRKRGRPRKDEQRPKPEPTRLERQTSQTVDQMLAELPTACDLGSKKNSKGYKIVDEIDQCRPSGEQQQQTSRRAAAKVPDEQPRRYSLGQFLSLQVARAATQDQENRPDDQKRARRDQQDERDDRPGRLFRPLERQRRGGVRRQRRDNAPDQRRDAITHDQGGEDRQSGGSDGRRHGEKIDDRRGEGLGRRQGAKFPGRFKQAIDD